MNRFNFSSAGPLASHPIAPSAAPAPDPTPAPDMPLGQKMCLLKLRKGELARAILDHLAEMSAPEPERGDWRALIDARLIRRSFAREDVTVSMRRASSSRWCRKPSASGATIAASPAPASGSIPFPEAVETG